MKWIRRRERVTVTNYSREFVWRDNKHSGFGFPCDKDGNINQLPDMAKENWDRCISGEYDVIDKGVVQYAHSYMEPAVIECVCGSEVELNSSWANSCEKCNREYNMGGQLLAPREQWGEETGERFV